MKCWPSMNSPVTLSSFIKFYEHINESEKNNILINLSLSFNSVYGEGVMVALSVTSWCKFYKSSKPRKTLHNTLFISQHTKKFHENIIGNAWLNYECEVCLVLHFTNCDWTDDKKTRIFSFLFSSRQSCYQQWSDKTILAANDAWCTF